MSHTNSLNKADYQKAFEATIVELCHSISKAEVKKLDYILIQQKTETNILQDLISAYPQFAKIFSTQIKI